MTDLSFYEGKKVLITGHTGFKGSWLSQILLSLGARICGVSLYPLEEPNLFTLLSIEKEIESHFIDIRDYEKVKEVFDSFKPDIVFHLAAQPIVIESYKEPRYTYDVNVMGTVNICECVRLSDSVRSFVNVTTDKVKISKIIHIFIKRMRNSTDMIPTQIPNPAVSLSRRLICVPSSMRRGLQYPPAEQAM